MQGCSCLCTRMCVDLCGNQRTISSVISQLLSDGLPSFIFPRLAWKLIRLKTRLAVQSALGSFCLNLLRAEKTSAWSPCPAFCMQVTGMKSMSLCLQDKQFTNRALSPLPVTGCSIDFKERHY